MVVAAGVCVTGGDVGGFGRDGGVATDVVGTTIGVSCLVGERKADVIGLGRASGLLSA